MKLPTGAMRRRNHAIGDDRAARADDRVTLAAEPLDLRDRRVLVDAGARPCRRLREADAELAHVHLHAVVLQQPAVETVGADLVAHPRRLDQLDVGIDVAAQRVVRLRQRREMLRLRGELELAGAPEIAIDRVFGDERLDAFHGALVCPIELPRRLRADARGQRRVVLRDAGVALSAVASRRFAGDLRGFQHDDRDAALRQCERGRQTGEAAADHDHVGAPVDGAFAAGMKRRTSIQPVRFEFHPILLEHCGGRDRRSLTGNHLITVKKRICRVFVRGTRRLHRFARPPQHTVRSVHLHRP